MTEFHISEKGLAVGRAFEGRSLHAYRDEVGVITIGYGSIAHDCAILGINLTMATTITEAQAEQLLRISYARLYEGPTNKAMDSSKLSQQAFDGGCDFTYNLGGGAIAKAGWVRQWKVNGDAHGILAYDHAGGRVLAGLTRRRRRELAIIENGDYGPEGRQIVITDEHGHPIPGAVTGGEPPSATPVPSPNPAWLDRMNEAVGQYVGASINPALIAMAKQGGIVATSQIDLIALDWALTTTGYGNGLQRIDGPTVGAVAATNDHVAIVRGRANNGQLIVVGGRGGDIISDFTLDPVTTIYKWPATTDKPAKVGIDTLPFVIVRPLVDIFDGDKGPPHVALAPTVVPWHLDGTPGTLKLDSTGDEVTDLQKLLVARGYKIAVTSTFDAETDKAVRDWQRRHPHLDPTGIVGPATRKSLIRADDAAATLKNTAQTGTVVATAGGAAHAAIGHFPWVGVAIGVVVVGLVIWTAWRYKSEIRAFFTPKGALTPTAPLPPTPKVA